LAKKRFCTRPIPFVAQQHIDHLPVLIHRAIEVEFLLAAKAEHFIHRPFAPHPPSMHTERGGQLGTKRLHPVQHCAGGDINIPLGEQPYHLSSREWQAAIPPHRHEDHVRGPTVPRKGGAGVGGEISVTGAAVVALSTTAVVSIAFRSVLLAGWARAHRYRMYPAPNNFSNSFVSAQLF
jgi:hypothetical protein